LSFEPLVCVNRKDEMRAGTPSRLAR